MNRGGEGEQSINRTVAEAAEQIWPLIAQREREEPGRRHSLSRGMARRAGQKKEGMQAVHCTKNVPSFMKNVKFPV